MCSSDLAMAFYPMMKPAFERLSAEGSKLQGTTVQSVTTVDLVQSAEEVAAADQRKSDEKAKGRDSEKDDVTANLGGFLKKMTQKKAEKSDDAAKPKDRTTILTTTSDVLKASTSVSAQDLAVPAGFKLEEKDK